MKKRKENKSEKEVTPVKKTVAVFLTIVTVLSFAAACFMLGFCSGKKVDSAYAANTQHSGGEGESFSGSYLYSKTSVKTKLAFSGIFGNTWTPVNFTGLPSFVGDNVWYVGLLVRDPCDLYNHRCEAASGDPDCILGVSADLVIKLHSVFDFLSEIRLDPWF